MPLPTYPTSPVPRAPYPVEPEFKTIINEMGDGSEERVQKWTADKQHRRLTYLCNKTDFNTILNFFIARKGRFGAFTFTCPWDGNSYTMRFDQDRPPVAQKSTAGPVSNTTMPMYEFSVDLVETNA